MADNTDDFSAFVVDDQQPEEEAWDVQKALEDTQEACSQSAKQITKCANAIQKTANDFNRELYHTLGAMDRFDEILNNEGNLADHALKARTEAQKAQEAMSDTADEAERIKRSFSELPTKENFVKQMQDYVAATCNAIMEQTAVKQKEMQKVNRDIQNERIKTALKWAGTLALVALVVCLFVFAVPAFFKTGMHFIDQHTWAQALAGVFMFVIVIGVIFLIGLGIGHN